MHVYVSICSKKKKIYTGNSSWWKLVEFDWSILGWSNWTGQIHIGLNAASRACAGVDDDFDFVCLFVRLFVSGNGSSECSTRARYCNSQNNWESLRRSSSSNLVQRAVGNSHFILQVEVCLSLVDLKFRWWCHHWLLNGMYWTTMAAAATACMLHWYIVCIVDARMPRSLTIRRRLCYGTGLRLRRRLCYGTIIDGLRLRRRLCYGVLIIGYDYVDGWARGSFDALALGVFHLCSCAHAVQR